MGKQIVDYPASRPEQLAFHDLPIPPAWLRIFFPNMFAFYSVKATCIKTTGIKLSMA